MFKLQQLEAAVRHIAPVLRASCPVIRLQPLSAAAQVKSSDSNASFRTNESSALKHERNHLARFYTLKDDVNKQLFTFGGLPKSFKTQAKTFNEACIMVREASLDVIECMKAIKLDNPAVRFVLYGEKGNGKSITLAHILQYAYEDGFLIVHVPWVREWMRRCKESSNSETKEGYININLDAATWLAHFKSQNSNLLSKPEFKTSQEYVWSKREKTNKDTPVLELIDLGINRVKYASDVVVALSQEIKKWSIDGVCKTFVAIDGINAFFYANTNIYTEKKEVVHPSRVVITEAFLNLTKFDWKNAVIVTTVDEIAIQMNDQDSYMPKFLLGKDGFNHMDPFVPIKVNPYNYKELSSCLDYYRERKWIRCGKEHDHELGTLSANNPYTLMQLTNGL